MRHKYHTRAIVLSRSVAGEDSANIALLTADFGLVRARAQGVRKRGAKNAAALQTLSACEIGLVRGKEGWRVAGAVLEDAWFAKLDRPARTRAGRMLAFIQRLVHGESPDPALYQILALFLAALEGKPASLHDAAEILTALRLLRTLGLDAGDLPGGSEFQPLSDELLKETIGKRADIIARVNRGIAASHL